MPLKNKRILIIRSGALGETVFALPVIDALQKQFGSDISIDWVGAPVASALFKLDPRIRRNFPLKHRKLPIFLSSEKRAIIRHSQKEPYDMLINLESGKIFFSLAEKINATHKLGMPYNQIRPLPKAHVIQSLKTLYDSIIDPIILENALPILYGESADTVIAKFNLPQHYIVINPSTSHHKKFTHRAWPIENWKELITRLSSRYSLVLIGGKGEEAFFEKLLPYPSHLLDLTGKTTITELITIIQNAEAIITADTGPSHLAAALNTRTFALFGPSNPQGTGPYSTPYNNVHIVSVNLDCAPCNATSRIKTCHDNQCMKQITPAMVETIVTPYLSPR